MLAQLITQPKQLAAMFIFIDYKLILMTIIKYHGSLDTYHIVWERYRLYFVLGITISNIIVNF